MKDDEDFWEALLLFIICLISIPIIIYGAATYTAKNYASSPSPAKSYSTSAKGYQ